MVKVHYHLAHLVHWNDNMIKIGTCGATTIIKLTKYYVELLRNKKLVMTYINKGFVRVIM
jgi:hypothetical protein